MYIYRCLPNYYGYIIYTCSYSSLFSVGDDLHLIWSNLHGEHEGHIDLDWLKKHCYSNKSRKEKLSKTTPLVAVSHIYTMSA